MFVVVGGECFSIENGSRNIWSQFRGRTSRCFFSSLPVVFFSMTVNDDDSFVTQKAKTATTDYDKTSRKGDDDVDDDGTDEAMLLLFRFHLTLFLVGWLYNWRIFSLSSFL